MGRALMSSIASQTAVSGITGSNLVRLVVPQPPLPAQQKMARVLYAYDSLVENNTRRIKILEMMAQALYREWFVHFRYPGYANVRLADSSSLPEGWKVKKVKDIILRLKAGRVYTGSQVSEIGIVPVIDQSRDEILGFHENLPDHIAETDKPVIIFGDHTCRMQMMVEPFSVGPNVVPFVSRSDMPIAYLFFLVRNLVETAEYKRHWSELMGKDVVVATCEVARKFEARVMPGFKQIHVLTRKNAILRRTRDLLLPKLISGEIRLGENP